jgi:hypothetical protein
MNLPSSVDRKQYYEEKSPVRELAELLGPNLIYARLARWKLGGTRPRRIVRGKQAPPTFPQAALMTVENIAI